MGLELHAIHIDDVDGTTILARISTPAGDVEILGGFLQSGRQLTVRDVHMQGPGPTRLGRAGLNAIARVIMDALDVDTIDVLGAVRTTGRRPGHRPRPVTFRR